MMADGMASPSPRLLAVEAVMRTTRDDLPLELPAGAARLSRRDRALAFEIATGTIRFLNTLDALLGACMNRPPAPKHLFTRTVLRTGLYQARHMRVPARAAVNEAVALVKRSREKPLAGFVNAVLRKAVTLDLATLLEKRIDPIARLALEESHPHWLVQRWSRTVDEQTLRARLAAGNAPGPLTLRVNRLLTDRSTLLEKLGDGARAGRWATAGILLEKGGPVEELPGYEAGWFAVQDQAAQLVTPLLQPRPGQTILDACAAPGGKTAHLAALTGDDAAITALEKQPARVARLRDNLARLRVKNVEVRTGDGGDPTLFERHRFDRILLDVPCSATGIIRRHPEIKWRRSARDLRRLSVEQGRLLNSIAPRLAPAGILLYVTCSLEPEENEKQVHRFLAKHPDWQRKPVTPEEDGVDEGMITAAGDFRTEPGGELDGFFASRLQRRS